MIKRIIVLYSKLNPYYFFLTSSQLQYKTKNEKTLELSFYIFNYFLSYSKYSSPRNSTSFKQLFILSILYIHQSLWVELLKENFLFNLFLKIY